jgi:hypothetical protein
MFRRTSLSNLLPLIAVLMLSLAAIAQTFDITPYAEGGSPTRSATADFNHDGLHDVATAAGTDLSIRLGTANGLLGSEHRIPLGAKADFLEAADFNLDGNVDLAISHGASKRISIALGKGDGTFDVTPLTTSGTPEILAVGDYNRDGKADFVVEISGIAQPALYFYKGDGTGKFSPSLAVASPGGAKSLLSADVNRDSKFDLVEVFDGYASVFFANGDGTFAPHQKIVRTGLPNNGGNRGGALADFNGDAVPDLVLLVNATCEGCESNFLTQIWENDRSGNFHVTWSSGDQFAPISAPVVGDFDVDGFIDIAYLQDHNFEGHDYQELVIAAGGGIGQLRYIFPIWSFESVTTLVGTDLNNDGRQDIIATNADGVSVSVSRQQPSIRLCAAPDSSKNQVNLCRITSGGTVWSPFVLQAVGNSPTRIARMEAWLDGKKVYQVIGDHILHTMSVTSGSHRLEIAAYDPFGKKGTKTVYFTGSNGSCVGTGTDRTVTVCTPGSDAVLENPLRVKAAAKDSRTVTGMKVYVDGIAVKSSSSGTIDVSVGLLWPDRRHVTVRAWDSLGNFSTSFDVNMLSGCTPKGADRTITLCSPVDGQLTLVGQIRILAAANDTLPVQTMQYYVDGKLMLTEPGSTLYVTIGSFTKGTHTISVKATDANGSFSKTVSVVQP